MGETPRQAVANTHGTAPYMDEVENEMKFNIPEYCEVRWQAALAVLEDLQEDKSAPFSMSKYADDLTLWERTNGCGTAACFAGYISVSPYCLELGYPIDDDGRHAKVWLLGSRWAHDASKLSDQIFHACIDKGSRAKTLAFLERRIKEIFKDSTGKKLVAPLTFWI